MGSLSDYLSQTPGDYDPSNPSAGGKDSNGYFHDPSGSGVWAIQPGQTPGDAYAADNPNSPAQAVNQGLPNYQDPSKPPAQAPSPTGSGSPGGTTQPPPPQNTNIQTNPPPNEAPITLSGKSQVEQATTLYNGLKKYGVNLNDFVVGGNSPYDGQIMQQVDVINNPNSTDAQRRLAAQNIQSLSSLRNSSVTGDGQMWVENGVASPNRPQTPATMIKGMFDPANPYGNPAMSAYSAFMKDSPTFTNQPAANQAQNELLNGGHTENANLLQSLINQFANGGVTDEQKQVQMSQLLEQIAGSDLTGRQANVDALAANGIQGGAMADALARQTQQSNAAKDQGMSALQLGILQQQLQSKQTAMQDIFQQEGIQNQASQSGMADYLQQAGLDWSSAQWLANEIATQQANQVNAGINYTGQQEGYGLQQRGQDLTYLMHLLDLASAGDQNAKNLATQMLMQLGMDTPASSNTNPAGS